MSLPSGSKRRLPSEGPGRGGDYGDVWLWVFISETQVRCMSPISNSSNLRSNVLQGLLRSRKPLAPLVLEHLLLQLVMGTYTGPIPSLPPDQCLYIHEARWSPYTRCLRPWSRTKSMPSIRPSMAVKYLPLCKRQMEKKEMGGKRRGRRGRMKSGPR
jgi:hypothetical protein